MDSLLRDIAREREKMQTDIETLARHYEKLAGFMRQYIEHAIVEWAKLVSSHQSTLLVVVETTRILDESGYAYSGENEPIRFTMFHLATGEVWDQLLFPTASRQVQGTAYHGLTLADLEGQPTIGQVWAQLEGRFSDHQVVIFGAEYASRAVQSVYPSLVLERAACLHNKCKEYYDEFYDLSLQKVLEYQGIDKKREDLTDSRERVQVLAQVVRNLAEGMPKQSHEVEDSMSAEDLDNHPF